MLVSCVLALIEQAVRLLLRPGPELIIRINGGDPLCSQMAHVTTHTVPTAADKGGTKNKN